jgi:ribosome-binding protein aMBF1 (putative translation factor)
MSHPSNFQDWNTVILRKNSKEIAKNNQVTEVQKKQSGNNVPKDIETPVIMVSHELKQKIITIRTTLKLKQDQLAKSINEPFKNIQLVECGKLSLKEAKQIAIKIERKYNVKILERT